MGVIADAVTEVLEAALDADARREAANNGQALPDGSFPIRNTGELRKAISAHGRAKDTEKVKRHIRKRAKALNAEHMLPDSFKVSEAADSMRKASTPEPFSSSRTSNWVARAGGLPAYVQHVAHDLMEKRGKDESTAIKMAVGIIRNWKDGKGNVDSNTRAAAAKAWAEWLAMRAKTKASKAVAEAVLEAVWGEPVIEAEDYAVAEASFGGLVKCPECGVLNVKSAVKCKNCGHDMKQVAAKAKSDGRSNVSEAINWRELLHPRNRRGEFDSKGGTVHKLSKIPDPHEVHALQPGHEMHLPGGSQIRRTPYATYHVSHPDLSAADMQVIDTSRNDTIGAAKAVHAAGTLAGKASVQRKGVDNTRGGRQVENRAGTGDPFKDLPEPKRPRKGISEAVQEALGR